MLTSEQQKLSRKRTADEKKQKAAEVRAKIAEEKKRRAADKEKSKLDKMERDIAAQRLKTREADLAAVAAAGILKVELDAQDVEMNLATHSKATKGTEHPWITHSVKKGWEKD